MRERLLRVCPQPVIRLLRRVRSHRIVQLVIERRALAALPEAPCLPGERSRSAIDLAQVWAHTSPALWQSLQDRLDALGLEHNQHGVNPGDRRAIAALVNYLQPHRVLEIGTHIGSSTVAIAATLAGTGARITTVDTRDMNDPHCRPWEQYGMTRSPAELVSGLAEVEFLVGDSLSYLANTSERYDFIFLDGDHTARTVYRELPLALSRLAPDGVILMHDYFPDARNLWPDGGLIVGPSLATDRLQREGHPVRVLPLGQLPWPTKFGSRVTSLAIALSG